MADIKRGSTVMLRLAKGDLRISTKLLRAWRKDEMAFQHFFNTFNAAILKRLSDQELLAFYLHYRQLFRRRVTSSAIIDHFALGTDEHIAAILRQEVGKLSKESNFTEIFSVATAPVRQSFINEAEMELLKLALKPRVSRQELERYQQRYFWIKNNYITAKVLSVGYFRKEITLWKQSGANLRLKYQQLRDASRTNAKRKTVIFKKYKFSRFLRTLLKISEDFTWWQDERKRSTFLNIHLGTQILGAMARRRGLDPEFTKYLLPSEVEYWFEHGKPAQLELRQRRQNCAFVVWRGGYYVATRREVERLRILMFPQKHSDEVRDIRGLSASVGRVVGPVKVLNSVREVGKIQPGDILVAVMTRPDYIMGIKKAAAIVTNEGGITCHAAIVSRELGIPCIIGTKIATEVLKDGDIVEVNANHGVVTVLKRK
ncbi:MAG: hypothetical protein HY974_03000 [Candidatus Kerfeldbacteria bacterium]|nr:hypothetical protein [Candidatus Kerfeldbacteria bacterium]